jgi:hypothetical protein
MLTAVKTTACGSGLRPVLTAAARGAVRCIWPGRRNRVAAEQRNPLIKCTHPEVPGRHLPRTLRIDLPERRWVSFIEHRGPLRLYVSMASGSNLSVTIKVKFSATARFR